MYGGANAHLFGDKVLNPPERDLFTRDGTKSVVFMMGSFSNATVGCLPCLEAETSSDFRSRRLEKSRLTL